MTPEGKIKAAVKKELDVYPHYREMPVPSGFGKSGLYFTVCFFSRFLAIETKRPGKDVTPRQALRIQDIEKAGGVTAVVSSIDEAKGPFRALLKELADKHDSSTGILKT